MDPSRCGPGDLPVEFGRYTLLGLLGQGGMARVFRAELKGPAGFRKQVALKIIRNDASVADSDGRQELINEARVGALLRHPNIVDTYELGQVDGHLFIAMELVEGWTLHGLLRRRGTPPPHLALDLAVQAGTGLRAAHALHVEGSPAGVVHRDLKPSNLLVSPIGGLKIADFGLVRATGITIHQTQSGVVRGTPSYLSPEQIQCLPLDGRSDLFALGAIVFELVVGRRLFDADQPVLVASSILNFQHRLLMSSTWADVERRVPGLAPFLVRCLQANPDDRYAEVGAFLEDLEALVEAHPRRPRFAEWISLEASEGQRGAPQDGGKAADVPTLVMDPEGPGPTLAPLWETRSSKDLTGQVSTGTGQTLPSESPPDGPLDWDWKALRAWEQEVLAQTSVFVGGFSLDNADRVVDLSAQPESPWTVDVMGELIEQGLLFAWQPEGVGG
ncbi:MAG: serine/threonine-protein kinase, partial [Myxococcota bacterium]|nr:serine/threonine-protein kinase [Myxococcota bacterium]